MITKPRILLSISFVAIILIGALYYRNWRINQVATMVSVSTDKQEYDIGDSVHISIQNLGDRSIDIYCPEFCALGNFPTTVERFSNGQWQHFGGFCPSIKPIFESGIHEGDYIRHTLSAKSSIELEISNLESLYLEQDERLRIVFYLGAEKIPIYSNEFIVEQ